MSYACIYLHIPFPIKAVWERSSEHSPLEGISTPFPSRKTRLCLGRFISHLWHLGGALLDGHPPTKTNKYLSTITLNVNGLNAPIKRHKVAEWIRNPFLWMTHMYAATRDPHQNKRSTQTEKGRVRKKYS